jgi:dGTPase
LKLKPLYSPRDVERLVPPLTTAADTEPYRSPYRRDYGRLIHCPAFRRLQGKTQLFPAPDSDFFRTRLSHSLEVAQIAKSIAIRINATVPQFKTHPINTDIVETAALAHDLGHPPFGHNGEYALDECMADFGGFEGNAQTLRILTRLEKRQTLSLDTDQLPAPLINGVENRAGLNLTFRTLAAVLKYDNEIPTLAADRGSMKPSICKGYYSSEAEIVGKLKLAIPRSPRTRFRTIECAIMDVADDIAYSTYDLEDAFKAEFLTPLSLMAKPVAVVERVAGKVKERLDEYYSHLPAGERTFGADDLSRTLISVFSEIFGASANIIQNAQELDAEAKAVVASKAAFDASAKLVSNGYSRAKLTSDLVGTFIQGVEVDYDEEFPSQSKVRLNVETFKRVEVLKNFAYQSLIMSPRLKVAEHRGKQIVKDIFEALERDEGHLLMPDDARLLYEDFKGTAHKKRVVCDFIACMTDRYALQFYNRLFGTSHESIHAPL